jgi:response regulator RpfG family c-di-GMP phosphodiesterase
MASFQSNTRVLFVDDEPFLLAAISSLFRHEGLEIHTLVRSMDIDDMLAEHGPFAVVVSDQRMPDRDGVTTLDRVRQYTPDTIRVILTGYADQDDTVRAINLAGISRHIAKPWDDILLKRTVHECVRMYNAIRENQHLTAELASRKAELEELHDGTLGETVILLHHLCSTITPCAAHQAGRVRALGNAVLQRLVDFSQEERWDILRSLDLFNLGISVLPAWILATIAREGLWSLPRFPVARDHQLLAYDLLKEIPCFGRVARIIQLSHKDFDGTGEPVADRTKGEGLPYGSRLLHILIDLDSLSTEHQRAHANLHTMSLQPGKYDPTIVALLLDIEKSRGVPWTVTSVRMDELVPGLLLTEDVVTVHGHILLRTGSEISAPVIRILSRFRQYESVKEPVTVCMKGPPGNAPATT